MASKSNWKTLLLQHDSLLEDSGRTLYRRVKLLQLIQADKGFQSDVKKSAKTEIEFLNDKVRDTCCRFVELSQMMELFPSEENWALGNLGDMRIALIRHIQSLKPPKTTSETKEARRQTATLQEVHSLKEEISKHSSEAESLRQQLKQANQIIKTLESQLEGTRETIGSLNETISLLKLQKSTTKRVVKSR